MAYKTMDGVTRPAFVVGVVTVVLAGLFVGYHAGWFESPTPQPVGAPDLSEHPIYSGYTFGKDEKVIDLGIQPLWLPGVISEVMRRDTILKLALAKNGMEVRFHSFLKGADVNFFLASGDLDAGIGGDMPALVACANDGVSVVSLIDEHFISIVARKLLMVPELKGKRIAYAYGSNAHYALMEILAAEGLGLNDVKLISMEVTTMADALHQGKIDAFSAWEPTPTIALAKYPEFVTINKALTTGYLYFSRAFAEHKPEVVRHIVAAQLRAMTWIRASRNNLIVASRWALNAGREIGGATFLIGTKLLAKTVSEGLLGISSSALLPDQDVTVESRLFRAFHFMQELGRVREDATWKDVSACFDPMVVPDVGLQAGRFQLHSNSFIADHTKLE